MWKVEVIERWNSSEAKRPWVLHLSDGVWRFNPNNEDIILHKVSLSFPLTQTEMPINIQTPKAGKKPDS